MEFVTGNPIPIQFARRPFPGVVSHWPVDREVWTGRPSKILTVIFNRDLRVSLLYSDESDFKRHPILARSFCPLNTVIIDVGNPISHVGFAHCDLTSLRK